MSIKANAYIALALSLVMLVGVASAPLCAHGTSCDYTARRGIVAAAEPAAPVAASTSHVVHCQTVRVTTHTSGMHSPSTTSMPATSGMPAKTADSGAACCTDGSASRMRLAEDRANFVQSPTVAAIAVAPFSVVPAMPAASTASAPAVSAPPQQALESTIIRI